MTINRLGQLMVFWGIRARLAVQTLSMLMAPEAGMLVVPVCF
jgi:hypothetical protein